MAKANKCVICGKVFKGLGNNPDPVKSRGRCCDGCNAIHVIPLRLSLFEQEGGTVPKP